jgi:DNA-binding GntR family transcriptional regulator
MHAIRKIRASQSLTLLAYNRIKSYILHEDFADETRLTENYLSRQLGISKSPVREALNSLSTEGLIRIEARRGAYLRSFSIQEVKDLYNLREALEVYAVSVAVLSPRVISELKRSTQRMRKFLKVRDKFSHIEEDARFHQLIASATGNTELCRVLANIQNQIWLCRRKTYNLSSSTSPEAHQKILDALEKGDRARAQAAMRDHIALVRQRLIDSMNSLHRVELSSRNGAEETLRIPLRPRSGVGDTQRKRQ